MTAVKNQNTMLKRLKKQVLALRRKEKAGRNKLRAALKKVNKLIRTHKSALNKKSKESKAKVAAVEARLADAMKNRAKGEGKRKKTKSPASLINKAKKMKK